MQRRTLQEAMLTVTEQEAVLIIAPTALHTEDLIHWVVLVITQVEVRVFHVWPLHVTTSAQALLHAW